MFDLSKGHTTRPVNEPCGASGCRHASDIAGLCMVSVSTSRSRDVPTSRLGLVSRKIVNVSVSDGRRLGLGHLRLMPKTNFRLNCASHININESILGATGVTIAHHINTLKQWTWKTTSRPVIAINKTCTLTSRSRLESYKRFVSAGEANVSVSSFYVSCPSMRHCRPTKTGGVTRP